MKPGEEVHNNVEANEDSIIINIIENISTPDDEGVNTELQQDNEEIQTTGEEKKNFTPTSNKKSQKVHRCMLM